MAQKRLSVVLAHPDDESFGLGGTLAKYAAQGVAIQLMLATRGEAGIPGMDPRATGDLREVEVRSACQVLGVQRLDFLGFPDGQLAAIPDEAGVGCLVEKLREHAPDIIITFGPDGISGHPDHVAVGRWATTAFDRLSSLADGPHKLYYLVPSEATQRACGGPPEPETVGGTIAYIDIDQFCAAKASAMRQHRSQQMSSAGAFDLAMHDLACHEVFRLAETAKPAATALADDLFSGLQPGDTRDTLAP
jgi:LmbE family N-acetylglucosaminyl deacetylase